MKRIIWLVIGAAVGILVVRKLSSKAAQLTPQGLAKQLTRAASDVADSVRGFADEVRVGMAEREAELRDAVLGDHQPNGHSGMDSAAAARLAKDPDAMWRTED